MAYKEAGRLVRKLLMEAYFNHNIFVYPYLTAVTPFNIVLNQFNGIVRNDSSIWRHFTPTQVYVDVFQINSKQFGGTRMHVRKTTRD